MGGPPRDLTRNPDLAAALVSLLLQLLNGRGHVAGQHLLPATCPRHCSTQGAPAPGHLRDPDRGCATAVAPQDGEAIRRRAPPHRRLGVPDVGPQGRGRCGPPQRKHASSPPATRPGRREVWVPRGRHFTLQAPRPSSPGPRRGPRSGSPSPRVSLGTPSASRPPRPAARPLRGEGRHPLPSHPPGLGQCPSGPRTTGPHQALPAAARPPVSQGQLWPPLPAALPSETQGRCRLSTLTAPQPSRGVPSARTCRWPPP